MLRLLRLRERLRASSSLANAMSELAELSDRLRADVDAVAERALAAPFPDASEAWAGMWSDGTSAWRN